MSDKLQQARLDAIFRQNFVAFTHRIYLQLNPGGTFVPGRHLDAIAYHLELVRQGKITRLIINMPPRYLKSIMASVAFPAFVLGHDPRKKIMCLSYGAELSRKHYDDFKAVVGASWYQQAFPKMRIKRIADSDVFTQKSGFRKTTSVGGALTGLGADIFIIDDPQKATDAQSQVLRDSTNAWFANTLVSRLDSKKNGAIIIVMQRVHLHDLTGVLTQQSNEWTVLNLAAIAESDEKIPVGPDQFFYRKAGEALNPAYESVETILKMRAIIGSENFSAQYQQMPVPSGGAMIKRKWLRYYTVLPERHWSDKVLQSWDCASKEGAQNDWSVCTTWLVKNKTEYYLMDVYRERVDYPTLRRAALALAKRYDPTAILIEDTSAGTALAQDLKELGAYRIKPIKVERSKIDRLFVQAAKFEAGQVFFPKDAPFLALLEVELLSFPQGKHDDQVDSITQALAFQAYGYDTSMAWVDN